MAVVSLFRAAEGIDGLGPVFTERGIGAKRQTRLHAAPRRVRPLTGLLEALAASAAAKL